MTLMLEIGAVASWFVIVITGRMPRGLFDLMVLAKPYIARSDAYIALLTETYPPVPGRTDPCGGNTRPPSGTVALLS